jgi:hypothetical protein
MIRQHVLVEFALFLFHTHVSSFFLVVSLRFSQNSLPSRCVSLRVDVPFLLFLGGEHDFASVLLSIVPMALSGAHFDVIGGGLNGTEFNSTHWTFYSFIGLKPAPLCGIIGLKKGSSKKLKSPIPQWAIDGSILWFLQGNYSSRELRWNPENKGIVVEWFIDDEIESSSI